MSVNEGSNVEPSLAEVLASIRRIAEFETSSNASPELAQLDDSDFVVPAFLRPSAHRAPAARALASPERPLPSQVRPLSVPERQSPVLPMPPAPIQRLQHIPQAPLAVQAAREMPHAARRHILPPAVETPRRTLDSAGALFAHVPATGSSGQTFASPWSSGRAVSSPPSPSHHPDPGFGAWHGGYTGHTVHDAPTATPHAQDGFGSIEDASADLLRPLLRQWLDENMSCMVARALQPDSPGGFEGAHKPKSS